MSITHFAAVMGALELPGEDHVMVAGAGLFDFRGYALAEYFGSNTGAPFGSITPTNFGDSNLFNTLYTNTASTLQLLIGGGEVDQDYFDALVFASSDSNWDEVELLTDDVINFSNSFGTGQTLWQWNPPAEFINGVTYNVSIKGLPL